MPLGEYRRKRHFEDTPEPAGKQSSKRTKSASKARTKSATKGDAEKSQPALRFVVQKHDATRLHYDFRLELDGVLKSWAVPKGPSLDPAEKRLAVQVEDHPLDYATFEGTIPKGNYGAGEVIVWDQGTYTPKGDPHEWYDRGQFEFELHGEKLHGWWVLILLKNRPGPKKNWLLVKMKDDEARRDAKAEIVDARPESVVSGRTINDVAQEAESAVKPAPKKTATRPAKKSSKKPKAPGKRKTSAQLPDYVDLELAMLSPEPPRGDNWWHEIKFDGYRMLCRVDHGNSANGKADNASADNADADGKAAAGATTDGNVSLITRNQQNWTHRYPTIARAARNLPVQSALLDGEIVALLENGVSSFQALQNAGQPGSKSPLIYYAFDLLFLDGEDLRDLPLEERKSRLREVIDGGIGTSIQISDHFESDGPAFFKQCARMGLEGIISKRRDRPYRAGRGTDWLKTKCIGTEELVIGGFTLSPAVKRGFGALLVGFFADGKLTFAGKVGTGYDNQTLLDLRKQLDAMVIDRCPFHSIPRKERGPLVRWVKPELIAEVQFSGWTDAAILRHPSFQGLREDKAAASIKRPESLVTPPTHTGTSASEVAMKTTTSKDTTSKTAAAGHTSRSKTKTEKGRNSPRRSGQTAAKRKSRRDTATGAPSENGTVPTASDSATTEVPLPEGVRLTHPERMLWPDCGLTKLGLATYYMQVAEWICRTSKIGR